MNELLSYQFSPLRRGDTAFQRGSGNGLAPILLAVAEERSLDRVERLEHEYALKAELDANWAARPIALTHYNGGTALVIHAKADDMKTDPAGNAGDRIACGVITK